jgi:hypothetical protein
MSDDPIGTIARESARQLTGEYGPGLETEVEAALYARETARGVRTTRCPSRL